MSKVKLFNITKDHSTPEDSAGLSSGFTPLTRRRVWLKAAEQISQKTKKTKQASLNISFPAGLSLILFEMFFKIKSDCRFSSLANAAKVEDKIKY